MGCLWPIIIIPAALVICLIIWISANGIDLISLTIAAVAIALLMAFVISMFIKFTKSSDEEDDIWIPSSDSSYLCTNSDCGYELFEDEEFCSYCGTPKTRPIAPNQVLICGWCHRELDDETKFCPQCGSEVFKQ